MKKYNLKIRMNWNKINHPLEQQLDFVCPQESMEPHTLTCITVVRNHNHSQAHDRKIEKSLYKRIITLEFNLLIRTISKIICIKIRRHTRKQTSQPRSSIDKRYHRSHKAPDIEMIGFTLQNK